MAKKSQHKGGSEVGNGKTAPGSLIEEFAQDLGNLLGEAQKKAHSWLSQRKAIADHLVGVRDTAARLLAQLGIDSAPQAPRGRRRGPGRPKGSGKRKRTMSPEARAKIAAAQRARWAKQKKAAAK